jgi:alpha-glucosidase (family GH31 glycosyl hydrolase)
MFGDAFLVAPVLEKNADKRKLFLPAGQWYNWHNNKMMTGGQWIEQPVTISEMPVFVKAGTVIPMWDAHHYNSTADYNAATPLTLRYFPGTASVNGFLYDDDGKDPHALENENVICQPGKWQRGEPEDFSRELAGRIEP